MKVHYSTDGLFGLTSCPHGKRVKVNSFLCTHKCKYYRSTNRKEKYVVCLADCNSQIKEIIEKIDVVIANDKCDDICFEEFISQIREDLAQILDNN